MFDFGFTEIALISVVALIVLGPERLPKVARTTGHLLGRLQRYVHEVKSDISREMELDELKKMRQNLTDSAHQFERSVRSEMDSTEKSLKSALPNVDADTIADAANMDKDDQGDFEDDDDEDFFVSDDEIIAAAEKQDAEKEAAKQQAKAKEAAAVASPESNKVQSSSNNNASTPAKPSGRSLSQQGNLWPQRREPSTKTQRK